jgi:tetratricopeptide (TPR) repeat protein
VQVSYYEAGQICDYITEKWSDAAILGMIKSYAVRHTTAEAIQENLHVTPGEFDKSFAEWLNARTGTSVQHFDEWKKQLKQGYADLANGKQKEAADAGLAALKLYPEYVGRDSGYELLATVHIATGKKQEAATELEKYRDLGGSDVETLKKLAQLEQGLGNKDQMRTTLQMLGTIYPEDAGTHRDLGDLLLNKGDAEHAIREYQAVLALHPGDVAQAHFDLARALEAAHRKTDAKDEVLLALEAAPDYKPAQHLLLELSQ